MSAAGFHVGPPADRGELDRFIAIAEESFRFSRTSERGDFLERFEPSIFRLVHQGGQLVGGLGLIECGQYFGGRAVPMVGIWLVAIAPEARGTGAGTALMQATVVELAARGVAISTLYPATQPIYRRAGYEQAGDHVVFRVPTASLPRGARAPAVERLRLENGAPDDELVALGRRIGRWHNGAIERDAYMWRRILDPFRGEPVRFRIREAGATVGWMAVQQVDGPGGGYHGYRLRCQPYEVETPVALQRMLSFLADYDSLCSELIISGPPRLAALGALAEYRPEVATTLRWMIRVIDPVAALTARGYLPGLRAELDLELADAQIERHSGRYRVVVADGRATVERGAGTGALRIGERGLAALFTGYRPAEELAVLGLASGPPDVLASASAVFAGSSPWLGEIF